MISLKLSLSRGLVFHLIDIKKKQFTLFSRGTKFLHEKYTGPNTTGVRTKGVIAVKATHISPQVTAKQVSQQGRKLHSKALSRPAAGHRVLDGAKKVFKQIGKIPWKSVAKSALRATAR